MELNDEVSITHLLKAVERRWRIKIKICGINIEAVRREGLSERQSHPTSCVLLEFDSNSG